MSKETSQVTQFRLFQSVDHLVLAGKQLRVKLYVDGTYNTKALSDVTVVSKISAILHTAFKDHVAKFDFLSGSNFEFQEFVAALFEVN